MTNYRQIETKARTWATAHLVTAAVLAFAVGWVVGVLM